MVNPCSYLDWGIQCFLHNFFVFNKVFLVRIKQQGVSSNSEEKYKTGDTPLLLWVKARKRQSNGFLSLICVVEPSMDEAEESTKNHKGSSIINISIVAIPSIGTSERFFNPFAFCWLPFIFCLEMYYPTVFWKSSWVCLHGPVIQANGRLTFEDGLRSGGLLHSEPVFALSLPTGAASTLAGTPSEKLRVEIFRIIKLS